MRIDSLRGLFGGLAALAVGAVALASAGVLVEAEVDGRAVVQGRMSQVGDAQRLRFDATAGSELTVQVKARKRGPTDFHVSLRAPDRSTLDLEAARRFKDKGRMVLVKRLTLPETGTYELDYDNVEGTGDYSVKLTATPARKFADSLTLGAEQTGEVQFAAPRGSRLSIRAKAAKGSGALPEVVTLGGATIDAIKDKRKGKQHKLVVQLDADGDLALGITNRGEAGEIDVLISVKAPKSPKTKLDLREFAPGDGSEDTYFSRTLPPGRTISYGVSEFESDIRGAFVELPDGAIATDTLVVVASSPPLMTPDPEDTTGVGPAVRFGPDGTTFATPVDLWVPYDPTALPFGTDPADLKVLRRKADGTTDVLTPIAVETDPDRVRLQVDGFSTFMVTAPVGPPDLDGRTYWTFLHERTMAEGGRRGVNQSMGTVTFGPAGERDAVVASELAYDLEIDQIVEVQRQNTPDGPRDVEVLFSRLRQETEIEDFTSTWEYRPDGRVRVGDDEESFDLWVARDGSALLGGAPVAPDEFMGLQVLVEKAATAPTVESLSGTYWMTETEYGFFGLQFGDIPAGQQFFRSFGTLTLRPNGTFRADLVGLDAFDPGGDLMVEKERESFGGTFTVETEGRFAGAVLLASEDDDGVETFRFLPSADGELLVGGEAELPTRTMLAGVCIRQSGRIGLEDLTGTYGSKAIEIDPASYVWTGLQVTNPEPAPGEEPSFFDVTVADFRMSGLTSRITFDAAGSLTSTLLAERRTFTADDRGNVQTEDVSELEPPFVEPVKLKRNGRLTLTGEDPFVGAVSPSGRYGFVLDDPAGGLPIFELDLLVEIFPPIPR